jgi:hypothetical protein
MYIAWACAHVTAAQHVLYSTRGRASHTTAIMRLRPKLAPWTWSAAKVATKVASTVRAEVHTVRDNGSNAQWYEAATVA